MKRKNKVLSSLGAFILALALALSLLPACGPDPGDEGEITMTVTSDHFRPAMEFGSDATVTIDYGDGSPVLVQEVNSGPTFFADRSFVDAALSHLVTFKVAPWTALTVLNLGFRGGDGGNGEGERAASSLPYIEFNPTHAEVAPGSDDQVAVTDYVGTVTVVEGLQSAPNLIALCCEWQPIATLDLSGCSELLTLEAYLADVQTTNFQGCVSLRRCCLESTGAHANWRVEGGVRVENEWLDLRDCLDIRDIRGTGDNHTMLYLHPGALTGLWHLCKMGNWRMETVKIGDEAPTKLDVSRFQALTQLWIAGSPVLGPLAFDNGATYSIWGSNTGITSIDIAGQSQVSQLQVSGCPITAIDISGCTGIDELTAGDCGLSVELVDYILATLDGFGRSVTGGYYVITLSDDADAAHPNAAPSATGAAHAQTLRDRGWIVTVNE